MLAKDLKIQNLKKQRENIVNALIQLSNEGHGDISLLYVGSIYPEVRKYLETEGFDIKDLHSHRLEEHTNGLPASLITISKLLTLNAEELQEAEDFSQDVKVDPSVEKMLYDFHQKKKKDAASPLIIGLISQDIEDEYDDDTDADE